MLRGCECEYPVTGIGRPEVRNIIGSITSEVGHQPDANDRANGKSDFSGLSFLGMLL